MSHFELVPYVSLDTQVIDGVLQVSASPHLPWLVEHLALDLADAPTGAPWLRSIAPGAFVMPEARGVTLAAIWLSLSIDQRAGVTVGLLKTLQPIWPRALFPLSAVLVDEAGGISLVPPFHRCVEGASKTWHPWQFDEYPIGGVSGAVTQNMAFTMMRLMAEVPLTSLFSLRANVPPVPSSRAAWLQPLDALTTESLADLAQHRASAAEMGSRWASVLAVLDDQYLQSAPTPLGELVAKAWTSVDKSSRWG